MFLAARAAGAAMWPPLLRCPHCCWRLHCRCHRLHQRHQPPLTLLGTTRSSTAHARPSQPCGKAGNTNARSLCNAGTSNAVACTDQARGTAAAHQKAAAGPSSCLYWLLGCSVSLTRPNAARPPKHAVMPRQVNCTICFLQH
jgi:hypothetical protein